MRIILTLFVVAATASSALAENDQAQNERLLKLLRSEWERQDCMWRETLRLTRLNGPSEDLKKTAGLVAYSCSDEIQKQISQNVNPATELPRMHGAAYDLLGAQERALTIARQLRELSETDNVKPPGKDDSK